jgi:hypothetical protein
MLIVDMAEKLSTGKSIFFFDFSAKYIRHSKRPGGEAVAAGDLYLPGGW